MNPNTEEHNDTAAACCAGVNEFVRNSPGTALMIAALAGIAIGLAVVRSCKPEPTPRDRAARLLDDLECLIKNAAAPAVRKAGELASEGADALHERLQTGEARLERLLRDFTGRLRKILS